MSLTPEEISRRVAALIEALQAELDRIDAQHGEARRAAIQRSGLPVEFVEGVLGSSSLHTATNNATIVDMSATEIVAPVKKRRGPPSEGVVTDLLPSLGLASMKDLADAIGENEANVRSWNHRKSIPDAAMKKIDKLRRRRR